MTNEERKIPKRVEIHTHTICGNVEIFKEHLETINDLPVSVFKTHKQKLEYFEVEFYNTEDELIEILCCPYGEENG